MKRISIFIWVSIFVSISCTKSQVNESDIIPNVEDSTPKTELEYVAEMMLNIEVDKTLCGEVLASVQESINKGLDENLFFRELWMNDDDLKVKSHNSESILKKRIEEYMENYQCTKSYNNPLVNSDIQIYWPYSENWDGFTKPIIAPATDVPQDTLIGYRVLDTPDNGKPVIETVLVDDEFAYTHPVWIINYSEISYEDIQQFVRIKSLSNVDSKAGGHYKWIMTKMQVNKQYDKLTNGASEFDVVVRFPQSSSGYFEENKTRIVFTRKEIRNKVLKIFSETEGMLNGNWHEAQKENLFVLIEYDGEGYGTSHTITGIEYKDPETGIVYSMSTTIQIEQSDTILLKKVCDRYLYFSYPPEFQHTADSNNIIWYSPITEY